jgi:hypothetical protein
MGTDLAELCWWPPVGLNRGSRAREIRRQLRLLRFRNRSDLSSSDESDCSLRGL